MRDRSRRPSSINKTRNEIRSVGRKYVFVEIICRDVDSRMDADLCNCEQLLSPWVIELGRHSQKVQENRNLTWQEVRKTDNRTKVTLRLLTWQAVAN